MRLTAVILAGGPGTRMAPLTDHRPKHLLETAGEPFIAHQLRWLSRHGVRRVLLATSYHAEMFEPVLGDGTEFGMTLTYVPEPVQLGTGGALLSAASEAGLADDEPLVAVNGDLFTRHNLGRQVRRLLEGDADLVIHTRSVPDPHRYGSVVLDRSHTVIRFEEKPSSPPGNEVNGGTYVMRRGALGHVVPEGPLSFESRVLPGLVANGRVVGYREQAAWLDVGTPAALAEVSRLIVAEQGRTSVIAADALVDPSARVTGGSAIGHMVRVGARADVSGSVVMDGAVIGKRAVVHDAVVGRGAVVAPGARFCAQVLGDGCTTSADAVPPSKSGAL